MSRYKSDEELKYELENRGYKVDEDDNFSLGTILFLGFLILCGSVFLHVLIYEFFYKNSEFVFIVFSGVLFITIISKGLSTIINFFLYAANIALLTVLYSYIVEYFNKTTYTDFYEAAEPLDFIKYAAIFIPYILLATFVLTKTILSLIKVFTIKKSAKRAEPLDL